MADSPRDARFPNAGSAFDLVFLAAQSAPGRTDILACERAQL
jgi:hypothetical protein